MKVAAFDSVRHNLMAQTSPRVPVSNKHGQVVQTGMSEPQLVRGALGMFSTGFDDGLDVRPQQGQVFQR